MSLGVHSSYLYCTLQNVPWNSGFCNWPNMATTVQDSASKNCRPERRCALPSYVHIQILLSLMLFGTVSERKILNTVGAWTRQNGCTNLVQNNTSPCIITSGSIYLGACRYCMKLQQLWYKTGWVSKRSCITERRETHRRAPGSIIPSKLVSCGSCLQISRERWDVSIASPIEMAKMGEA